MISNSIKRWAIAFLVIDSLFYSYGFLGELVQGYIEPEGFFIATSYFYFPVSLIYTLFDFFPQTVLSRIPFIILFVAYHMCLGAGVGWLLRKKNYHWALMGVAALCIIVLVNIVSIGLINFFVK